MSKCVFVAFAIEDKTYRDFLAGQAKLDKSPFEFTDMSARNRGTKNGKQTAGPGLRVATGSLA